MAMPRNPFNGATPHITPRITAIICRSQYITSKNSSCEREYRQINFDSIDALPLLNNTTALAFKNVLQLPLNIEP